MPHLTRTGNFTLQKEIITAFSKEAMQKYLDFVEKRLKENNGGKGFVVGDKVSSFPLSVKWVKFLCSFVIK